MKQIGVDLEQTRRFMCENHCWLWVLIGFDCRCRSTMWRVLSSWWWWFHHGSDLVAVVRWSIYAVSGLRRCWWVLWEITGMLFYSWNFFFFLFFVFDFFCWNFSWFGVDFGWNGGDGFGWFWVKLWQVSIIDVNYSWPHFFARYSGPQLMAWLLKRNIRHFSYNHYLEMEINKATIS